MQDLTPLDTIPAFDAATREQLVPYWIMTAEEFVTTTRADNTQFGNGLVALSEVLSMPQDAVLKLAQAAEAALPEAHTSIFGAADATAIELGTGAIFDGMHLPDETSFDLPLTLPPEANLIGALPPPQQQGKRNTCLAFTLAALYQHLSGESDDLSEQFLYWACKEYDGIPRVRGTRPDIALDMLRTVGICMEATWPYQPQQQESEGQGPPPPGAVHEARLRRISGYTNMPARSIRQMQHALAQGHALLVGLPIQQHWTTTWQARTLGRVRQPLPGESPHGGHAMAVFGYRDDASVPGGGYVIVRNSWGTTWGSQNPDGAGYCHIPYQVIADNCLVCIAIDGLASTPTSTTSADTPRQELSDPPGTTGNGPTPGVVAGGGEPAPSSLFAEVDSAYQEARTIRDRLNTLTERLAALRERVRLEE